jgi:hypothetical protein
MAKFQGHVAIQSENNISALYYMKYLVEKHQGKVVSFPSTEYAHVYKPKLDELFDSLSDDEQVTMLDYCTYAISNFTRDHEYLEVANFKDEGLAKKECQKLTKAYSLFSENKLDKDGNPNKKYVVNPLEDIEGSVIPFDPFRSYYVAVIS